jgi:uncharacterized repeat protein (TIGR01451 family)
MPRFRVGLAVVTMTAIGVPVVSAVGGGVANAVPISGGSITAAAPISGGDITAVCAGTTSGTTFTLTADCGEVTSPLTVPPTITTVDGGGHTISATDLNGADPTVHTPIPQWNGGIVTNAGPGQTMNIQNVTITGPAAGFSLCGPGNPGANAVLYGIFFNGAAGGSVSNVTVQHIFQFQNGAFGSCQTGRAIRADNSGTVTITGTTVTDYQKSGFEARGSTVMNVSGSTAGPPHPLGGLIAQNGVSIVGAAGTVANNTIFGSGDAEAGVGGGSAGTAVLLFGAHDVNVTNNTLTSPDPPLPGTDLGISVAAGSTGIVISFNKVNRLGPDVPDTFGIGIDVNTFDGSMATLMCNTFSQWQTNVVGAEQIACTPLPNGIECHAYSAPAPAVDSGKNYDEAGNIIDATPFSWTLDSGTLPPGLSLSSAGAITGIPTAVGTFNFTLKLVDSTGLTATQAQTIMIAPGCAASIQITPSATNPVGATHTFTAHVSVDSGLGPANAPDGTQISFTIDSGPGAFTSPNPCTTAGGTGSCTITLVSNTPGATVVSAHVTVSVGSVLLTRQTDGTGGNSGPATKLWAGSTAQTTIMTATGAVTTITAGTVVHDQIFVAKAAGTPAAVPAPAGNVLFHRYATIDCTGASTDQTVPLTPGSPSTAVTDTFAPTANVSYQAMYLGNANYPPATSPCEPLTVVPAPRPGITIVKNPSKQTVAFGGTAHFRITVTNTGNTVLTNVRVHDPNATNCKRTAAELPALATMNAGAVVSYSCSRTNVRASFANVATATGLDPTLTVVSATARGAVVKVALFIPPPKPKPKTVAHKRPRSTG